TPCVHHHAADTQPSRGSTTCSENALVPSPTTISPKYNGFKLVCLSEAAAWASEVCRRLHLQPSWLQLRAHVTSRRRFFPSAKPRRTRLSTTYWIGGRSLSVSRTSPTPSVRLHPSNVNGHPVVPSFLTISW